MIKYERHEFLELFDDEIIKDENLQQITYVLSTKDGFIFKLQFIGNENRVCMILEYLQQQKEPIFEIELVDLGKISTDQKYLSFLKKDKMQWCDDPFIKIQVKPFIGFSHAIG